MEANQDLHSASNTPASAFEDAGRVVLMDFTRKLETTLEEERLEKERHKQAIEAIIARRTKLNAGILALNEFYPQSLPEGFDSPISKNLSLTKIVYYGGGPIQKDAQAGDSSQEDGGSSDDAENGGGFARGEMKHAMLDVIAKADTFLTTDEIANGIRERFPDRQFSNKRVTDALKDNRRRKDIIGENVFRGKFPMFLNGLPSFYSDVEKLMLKDDYHKKFDQRMNELGFTPAPIFGQGAEEARVQAENGEEAVSIANMPDDASPFDALTDEDVARAQELLKRPKAALGLF